MAPESASSRGIHRRGQGLHQAQGHHNQEASTGGAPVVTDPIRVSQILVGLSDVTVLGVDDVAGEPLQVHVE